MQISLTWLIKIKEHLTGDAEAYANPKDYFDQVIEINLSELELHLNGPFTPDLATPDLKMKEAAAANNWPTKIEVGLIGSCTNSSYEDISRAVSLANKCRKGLTHYGLNSPSHPDRNRFGIPSNGMDSWKYLTKIGATVFANACGPLHRYVGQDGC